MPKLPLFREEADMALAFFDRLRLPDVLGNPTMKEACGSWFREIVEALFGSRDPDTNIRYVREIFALVGKGNSKTTYSGALMIVALLMNVRRRVEFIFLGPTQAISDLAFDAAKGMIELDSELMKRFHVRDHKKEIFDRVNKAKMRIKTFDLRVMTGPKPAGVLIDEIHLLGKSPYTMKMLRQIRGGMEKNTDGFIVFITTQSDDIPVGAFESELKMARAIRNGDTPGRMLPLLYEFPEDVMKDPAKWQDPKNWPMVIPNLGRSLQLQSLKEDWETEKQKGEESIKLWASQHLSIQIGIAMKNDGWKGAKFWKKGEDESITIDTFKTQCEAVVVGLDGGGLDDLYGVSVLGRLKQPDDKGEKRWISWSKAWCHRGVLEDRKSIASALSEFESLGELRIVDDDLEDIREIADLIKQLKDAGCLVAVAVDPEGLGEMVEALADIGITVENGMLKGIQQGYALMNAMKTAERKLANGTLKHAKQKLMDWCVGNIKIEPTATAIRATKQNAGDLKIDPAIAQFNAVTVMVTNPQPPPRSYLNAGSGLLVL